MSYVSGVDYERLQPPMVDVESELNILTLAAAKKKLEEHERKRAIARKAGTVAAMELTEDELSGITELPAYMIALNKEQVFIITHPRITLPHYTAVHNTPSDNRIMSIYYTSPTLHPLTCT